MSEKNEKNGKTVKAESTGKTRRSAAALKEFLERRSGETREEWLSRLQADPSAREKKLKELTAVLAAPPRAEVQDLLAREQAARDARFLLTCCTFREKDAEAADKGMEIQPVKEYGEDYHVFDDGFTNLVRCRKCGCLMLETHSVGEFLEDSVSAWDYYPVADEAEGDRYARQAGSMAGLPGPCLKYTSGHGWYWDDWDC